MHEKYYIYHEILVILLTKSNSISLCLNLCRSSFVLTMYLFNKEA